MKSKLKLLFPLAFGLMVVTGCEDMLEVKNENNPDFDQVYSSGEDLENLTAGLFSITYAAEHSYSGVQMGLATASDNVSCSWGNQAMRHMGWEPRDFAWDNNPSYSYAGTTKYLFDKSYAAINTASNILKAINNGVEIGTGGVDNERSQAVCKFIQGVSYGDLALVFDKAFIVDEDQTVEGEVGSAVPYSDVAAAAVGYLDEAIALCANTFTIPAGWLGAEADLSNADFAKLCNTYAARILSYMPRNATELAAVDWNAVKTYADAGITSDFNVVNDNYVQWYNEAGDYLTYNGWGVTDMYVVNLMDPAQPQHWDDTPAFPHPPASTNILTDPAIDDRLETDFAYLGSNWFQASRGYYWYSNYRFDRLDAFYVNADGPRSEVLKAENDMLKAEARAYLAVPDLAGAAAIINAGTRVTRGGLANVGAVKADIIAAIHHERHVEMYVTGMGLQFFEMRKLDLLQTGTPLHLPLPAGTLQTFGESLPFYTYGRVAEADGVNTSDGGWR